MLAPHDVVIWEASLQCWPGPTKARTCSFHCTDFRSHPQGQPDGLWRWDLPTQGRCALSATEFHLCEQRGDQCGVHGVGRLETTHFLSRLAAALACSAHCLETEMGEYFELCYCKVVCGVDGEIPSVYVVVGDLHCS